MNSMLPSEFKRGAGVLIAAFIGLFFSVGTLVIYSFGIFAPELGKEFGWNRIEISFGITVFNYSVMIAALVYGYLIDRFGPRIIVIISTLLFIPIYFAFSKIGNSLHQFYLVFCLMAILGGGTLPVSYSRIIVGWFTENRGLALGIALSGVGVGAALLPPILQASIDAFGWRGGAMLLAGGIALISLPATIFLLKDPLEIEQAAVNPVKSKPSLAGVDKRVFLTLLMFSIASGLFLIGALIHFVPILQDRGLAPATAARYASLMGISVIVGRITIGFFVDRVFAPRVIFVFYMAPIAAFLILRYFSSDASYIFAAMAFGLALGAEVDVIAYMVSRYFGWQKFGLLYGIMFAGFTAGAANGPLLLGVFYENTGNYNMALMILALIAVITALSTFLLPQFPVSDDLQE